MFSHSKQMKLGFIYMLNEAGFFFYKKGLIIKKEFQ